MGQEAFLCPLPTPGVDTRTHAHAMHTAHGAHTRIHIQRGERSSKRRTRRRLCWTWWGSSPFPCGASRSGWQGTVSDPGRAKARLHPNPTLNDASPWWTPDTRAAWRDSCSWWGLDQMAGKVPSRFQASMTPSLTAAPADLGPMSEHTFAWLVNDVSVDGRADAQADARPRLAFCPSSHFGPRPSAGLAGPPRHDEPAARAGWHFGSSL